MIWNSYAGCTDTHGSTEITGSRLKQFKEAIALAEARGRAPVRVEASREVTDVQPTS